MLQEGLIPRTGLQWGNTATAKPAQQGDHWGEQTPHFSLPSSDLLLVPPLAKPKGQPEDRELSDAVQSVSF